jgi:hypothetical protein
MLQSSQSWYSPVGNPIGVERPIVFNISLRLLQLFYCLLMGAVAILCLVEAGGEWQRWHGIATTGIVFLACAAAFFALTAYAVLRGRRLGARLAGISGALLLLYALSVLLLGWEDVGDARGAVPLAAGTALMGLLGLIVSFGLAAGVSEAA